VVVVVAAAAVVVGPAMRVEENVGWRLVLEQHFSLGNWTSLARRRRRWSWRRRRRWWRCVDDNFGRGLFKKENFFFRRHGWT